MVIIDGKKIARGIIDDLKKMPKPEKTFAAIFVGSSKASESFLKQKEKVASELGLNFQLFQFPDHISEDELFGKVREIGSDRLIGGMIIQLPLPPRFSQEKILQALDSKKDVDAIVNQNLLPLPVMVVSDVLVSVSYDLKDKIVAVVGRGMLVGKPVAKWLEGKCKEVLIFHSKTNLADLKKVDLIITGVGKAGLIKPEMLKEGAGVIDFGFDIVNGKIRGDLDSSFLQLETCNLKLAFYTPTPGGTGPILVAELFKNFYSLASSGTDN